MSEMAMENVKAARSVLRPTSKKFVEHMIEGFIELHGDRRFSDDAAVIGGVGWLDKRPITVIAIEKGEDTKERVARNFGSAHPEGYRKALRLMKQAEKFKRPVLCIVDTSGAFCGIEAEMRGQGAAIAENLMEMMTLQTPIISIFIGEGGSGGALALAVADRVWMLEKAVYSVISPEGCASILWKDTARTEEAANCLKLTAGDLHHFGVIERIFEEEPIEDTCGALQHALSEAFAELSCLSDTELLEKRYQRFRRIGVDCVCFPS